MSSVVNKSGTRFIPKARQRRAQPPATPILSKPAPVITKETSQDVKHSDSKSPEDEGMDGSTQVTSIQASTNNNTNHNTLNDKADVNTSENIGLSQTSTQVDTNHVNHKATIVKPSFRVNRLGSLSKDTTEKPNFKYKQLDKLPKLSAANLKQNSTTSNNGSVATRRRLSSISNKLSRKPQQVSQIIESEKATLNTLKRRKLSTRTPVSKKSGSTHRISIVSKIPVPAAAGIPIPTANNHDDEHRGDIADDGLFQRTSEYYKKYMVKSVREIPKNIEEKDSSKYVIDENNFTMAELCKRTLPIGEVSDNFERSKSAFTAKMSKRRELRELRQKARSEFKSMQELSKQDEEEEKARRKEAQEKLMNAEIPEERVTQSMQLKLTADGSIAVDEESTVVDRHKNASLEHAQKKKVDENPFDNLYNNNTYGRASYTDPWTAGEMVKYYKALSMWGTDFNLIAQLFPYRTRRQVKAKFTNEEKKHPVMVELALRAKLPPNFEQYCTDIRKNIPTVQEFDEKIKSLQKEHELHLKELEEAKHTAKLEDQDTERENETRNMTNKRGAGGFTKKDLKSYRKKEVVLGTIDDIRRKREEEEKQIPSDEEGESESNDEEEGDDEEDKEKNDENDKEASTSSEKKK